MGKTILRWSLIGGVLFAAISFLGGSLFWYLLGFGQDLSIEGQAPIVRPDVSAFGGGWPAYGGDQNGTRYSAAAAITPDNVDTLTVAWTYQSGTFKGREHLKRLSAFEATPILVEDSLIFCTQFNEVIAIDPGTGQEKWRHDPKVRTDMDPDNQFTCRGVAYWKDTLIDPDVACATRIFAPTVDARIIAVDAKTGLPCTEFDQDGQVQLYPSSPVRGPGEFSITSAPAVIGDVVVTGSSIGDNQRVDAPHGTVVALDARTGERKWSFDPIPRDPADPARKTWHGQSADITGHTNVWSSMSVDETRNLIFLPTSSPSPDFYGGERLGDNRYANSVVALKGDTGKMAWHYQTVHHDVFDYDIPAQPGLYQVWRDGKAHDVVAVVTKQGFVFVLDRDTGEPFLPIEERSVPQSDVPGEVLSPTQPFPVNTPPLVPHEVDPRDGFGLTLWDKMYCQSRLRNAKSEGIYTPPSFEGTLQVPFSGGGANWGSAAFDPARNLLVVNVNNAAHIITLHKRDEAHPPGIEMGPMEGTPYKVTRELLLGPVGLPCTPPPFGMIAGVDLDSGEIVWRRKFGTTQDLAGGLALPTGTPNFGGPIVTGGGVTFIGAAMDDYLRAFDTATGEELWAGRLPAGGQATPMTYSWRGKQYVVIAAGGHGRSTTTLGDYVVAFALPD